VNATRTAGVCLVLAGIALAGPAFRIGTKLTWQGGDVYDQWAGPHEETLFQVTFLQTYVGPTIEASYGPAWGVLTGRFDLAQVSMFTTGGVAFRLCPMLGLDVMLEPPTRWRVKPYVWAGVGTIDYWMPLRAYPVYQQDAETHWRGGLGGKYRLSRRIDAFAEMQVYRRDDFWNGYVIEPDGTVIAGDMMVEAIGLMKAEVGVRFALGN